MNWTIHSIGDSAFLEQILIAVAMITGTADFEKMAAIGMLIGVLLVAFQSIFQGATQFNLGQVFVCWIIYALAFGVPVTVTIEDAYSGEVRVVDNVPMGAAGTGSLISRVGFGITRLFEVAYSPIAPGITEKRFLSSLDLISAQRNLAGNAALWAQWDKAVGGGMVDMQRSWQNYVADCTAIGFQLGAITQANLKNLTWRDALKFDSSVYGTELFVSPSGSITPTCTDGWVELMVATDTAFASQLSHDTVNYLLGLSVGNVAGINPINETTNALDDLTATGVVSSDMLKAAVLSPILTDGFGQHYQNLQQTTSALMLEQAVQQRNTQWAAEQSNFMLISRPMMTFFEGFVYAITPLAAFMIVMAGKGIQLAGKYLQTLMWIQLWMPVLSIINLYIYTRSQRVMTDFIASGGDPTSLEGILHITNELSNQLATGGMLAAATPVISLFIVTGSNYAFTSLAQRTAGSDHINEKMTSPDLLQRGPISQQMAGHSFNSVQGGLQTGAENMIDKVDLSRMSGSLTSSGRSRVEAAQDTFQTQLANSFFSGNSADQSYQRLQSFGQMLRSSDSSQAKAVVNAGQQYAKEHGLDGSQTNAVIGALGARMTAGVDAGNLVSKFLGPAGVAANIAAKKKGENTNDLATMRGDINASAESRSTAARTQMTKDLDRVAKDIGFTKDDSASLTSDVASQLSDDKSNRLTESVGEEQRRTLSHSASQMLTAQNTFQRLDSAQKTLASATSTDMRSVAGKVIGDQTSMDNLGKYMQQAPSELRQAASNRAQFYRGLGMESDRAMVGGALYAMLNSEDFQHQANAAQLVAGAIASPNSTPPLGADALANKKISETTPTVNSGSIQTNKGGLAGPSKLTKEQREMPNASLPGGDSDVYATHGENMDSVNTQHDRNRSDYTGQRLGELRERIMANDVTPSKATKGFATAEGAGRFVETMLGKTFGGIGAAASGFADNFGSSMERLANMTPEQRDQFIEDVKRGDEYVEQEWGAAGKALTDIASLGRGIMGAGVSGYSAAKEWLSGESDLSEAAKGMSLQERGMFFASALVSASEHGSEAAERFVEQYDEVFKNMATVAGSEAGLNHTGAQLFAASLTGDDQEITSLREKMREDVADSELADRMSNIIETSAGAGKDQASGYLNPVARYMSVSRGQ